MEITNKCGIYTITNNLNGKIYVGQTNNFKRRLEQHKGAIRRNEHNKLYDSIYEYGIENFTFSVIEELPEDENVLNEHEIYWINYFNSLEDGYNTSSGGGVKRDEQTKHKCSIGGKKGMTNANHKMWQDPEYRKQKADKMRETVKKLWQDENYVNKRKIQLSELAKNMWQDPEYRGRLTQSISERQKILWQDPEYRSKMSKILSDAQKKFINEHPEYRIELSERSKALWKDKEYHDKMCIKLKDAAQRNNSNPEYRKKHKERWKKNAVQSNLKRWSFEEEHKKLSERNKNSMWINDGKENKKILISEIDKYDPLIWKHGMLKGTHIGNAKGTVWINDGEKCKMVAKDDIQKYLDQGFVLGRLKKK